MLALVDGPIDVAAVRAAVSDPGFGAILVFEGVGRDTFDGRPVLRLEYEAWPEMVVPALARIAAEASDRWGARVAIVHRTGVVAIGEPSVVIAVGTPHRAACYEASRHCIEALKASVPIWKKEIYADGSAWKANTPGGEPGG